MSYPGFLKRIFANAGAGPKILGSIIPFGSAAPKAPGTASAGSLDEVARADHVHPGQSLSANDLAGSGLQVLNDKLNVKPADFIKINGGLAVGSDGKVYVDFSKMPDSEMRNVVLSMVQTGGGIGVDPSGKLYVDFGSMPTNKFDAMIKSLRLPIWLTADKFFFVNKVSGSDILDEGRGESQSKPFKTIQACVNYIADNYNISRYTAYIEIADGTYEEILVLPEFSRNTGLIILESQSQDRSKVVLVNRVINATPIMSRGGTWALRQLTIDQRPNFSDMASQPTDVYTSMIDASNADISLYGCLFRFAPVGNSVPNHAYINYGLSTGTNGQLHLRPWTVANRFETGFDVSVTNLRNYILTASQGGILYGYGTNNNNYDPEIELNALYDVCAYTVGGSMRFNMPFLKPCVITNEARANGKRYSAINGGSINVNGAGADYFPGANPGTADAGTFSWYQ